MDKKFQKVRSFTEKHPRITSAAAGVVVGGVVVAKLMYAPSKTIHLNLTVDQFQKLQELGGCIEYKGGALRDIIHISIPQ